MPKPVILFLAAHPEGTTRVALDEECAATERELRMTPGCDDLEFRARWAVTVDDVMRALNELRPAIVHFSGHGNAAGIVLQDPDRNAHPVTGDVLAGMITATSASVRVAVLNACFTDGHAQRLGERIGCAIGMSGTISDEAARQYSIAFYRALGYRCSVYAAFRQAQETLLGLGLDKQAAPRCVTRADIDASAIVIAAEATHPAGSDHGVQVTASKPGASLDAGAIQVSNETTSGSIQAPVFSGIHGDGATISITVAGHKGAV